MRLFKTNLVVALCVVIALVLFGCGEGSGSTNSNGGTSDTSTTATKPDDTNTAPDSTEQAQPADKELTLGDTFSFDGLEITMGTEVTFTTLENQFSEKNGEPVIVVPIKVTNTSQEAKGLNMFYTKTFGSKGTQLSDVSAYFSEDDINFAGEARPGATLEGSFHFLYDGDGDYYLAFDNFSEKLEVKIPVKQ